MRFFHRLFDFYVFSSIHVALGVFCFVKLTLLSYTIGENDTAIFVFFSTIASYNFIRFNNISKSKNWMSTWYLENKIPLFVLTAVSSLFCLYYLVNFDLNVIFILTPFILLTFFYGTQLNRRAVSLRKIPGLKIFLIAFCYAGITVLFPLVHNEVEIGFSVFMLFIQRLFFVVLITIPFDIRDVAYDSSKLKTIPQRIGIRNAKITGVILAFIVLFLELFFLDNGPENLFIFLIIKVISVLLLLFSKVNQSKYYSAFWIEAIPIIWYGLLFVTLNM